MQDCSHNSLELPPYPPITRPPLVGMCYDNDAHIYIRSARFACRSPCCGDDVIVSPFIQIDHMASNHWWGRGADSQMLGNTADLVGHCYICTCLKRSLFFVAQSLALLPHTYVNRGRCGVRTFSPCVCGVSSRYPSVPHSKKHAEAHWSY